MVEIVTDKGPFLQRSRKSFQSCGMIFNEPDLYKTINIKQFLLNNED